MNLLFYTAFKITPTKGGTEHTSLTVATELHKKYGCKCWAFHLVDEKLPDCECFEKQYYVNGRRLKKELRDIIVNNKIDVVLSQGGFEITSYVDEIRKEEDVPVQNILVHHFTPGWEVNFGTKIDYIDAYKSRHGLKKLKALVKLCLFPYYRHRYLSNLPIMYRKSYEAADKVVLLTKGYIPMFQEYGKFHDDKKFCVIPNALSLPDILDKSDYESTKKNDVLVVSRLEEIQKRISLVLKIWEQVTKDDRSNDWELLIAGEGIYKEQYEEYVRSHKIPRMKFLGRVSPAPYYTEASIFMMTSRSEGFPLTLNEAMQYGVIPLAFDSFASIRDIINDGENGFIIPEMDMDTYKEKVLTLMEDADLRHRMAMNALDSCRRYLPERIGEMWWKLLNKH